MQNFCKMVKIAFDTEVLSKISLPELAEGTKNFFNFQVIYTTFLEIMWNNYDATNGNIFSFGEKFKFLNEAIRASFLGGPTICFHRHCEINSEEDKWHESVTRCPNGEPYRKIISYDFNGKSLF